VENSAKDRKDFVTATLIMVRHGETVGESSVRYHGRSDVRLSPFGRAQMRAAARFLAQEQFVRVFSSPLKRATESAHLIAGKSAVITTIADFVEIDFGLFEGLMADEIRARYPDHFAHWEEHRFEPTYAYPLGESRAAFNARVSRGLKRMLQEWQESAGDAMLRGSALLTAHRGVIRAVARCLAGVEPVSELGSIHILAHRGNWYAERMDIIEHLRGLPADPEK
jgi:broad specificity phosphatase PhoE